MPDIIHLLPDSIANQIAAGEVVQRPASAVKELMENSVDAGATHITLILKDAGKALIQVIDNGSGMSVTDARMSLERHATSKIRSADDLFRIRTMGFRGEALASIAAVAQVEIKTRQAHQELGTSLIVEGSDVKKQEPAACEKGTNICVKNLFYNIPARRNFLKSNPVELRHAIDEFQRLALAHAEIGFTFIQGDETVYDLPPGKLSQRIVSLFGKSYQEQLAACSEETSLLKVTGYVGRPESAKKTRGEQFFFVNQRFVKNNYLNHAVMGAFEGLLQDGSFPFYVLFIEIDPKHVDVNVHPTKTEIKFDDERAVYAVVRAAARQALGSHNLTPAIDFGEDVNIITKLNNCKAFTNDQYYEEQFGSLQRANLHHWESLFTGGGTSSRLFPEVQKDDEVPFSESVLTNSVPVTDEVQDKTIFQLQGRFIVRPVANGLMIVDQQPAHERVLFEKLMKHFKGTPGMSQQSLFPQAVNFSPTDFALILEMEQEITALGFRFEVFGKNTLLVSGIPSEVKGNEKELFEGLIEQFKRNQAELAVPVRENLARSLARRSSVKTGQKLSGAEMNSLVDSLMICANPNYSPEGSTTFFVFDTSKIENYFSR